MRLSYVPSAFDGSSTPGASQIWEEQTQTMGDCAAAVPTPKFQPGLGVYTLQNTDRERGCEPILGTAQGNLTHFSSLNALLKTCLDKT